MAAGACLSRHCGTAFASLPATAAPRRREAYIGLLQRRVAGRVWGLRSDAGAGGRQRNLHQVIRACRKWRHSAQAALHARRLRARATSQPLRTRNRGAAPPRALTELAGSSAMISSQAATAASRSDCGISSSAKTLSRPMRSMVTTVRAPTRTRPTVSASGAFSGAAPATAAGSSAVMVCTAALSAGSRSLRGGEG